MKKLVLIKLAAISVTIAVTLGLASCNGGEPDESTPAPTNASQTTFVDTDPGSDPSEQTTEATTIDPASIDFKASKTVKAETADKTEKGKTDHANRNHPERIVPID